MSGYQQVPGYNPSYPQQGQYPPQYPQQGYQQAPPQYPPQYPQYPPQSPPPVTVNVTNSQGQYGQPTVVPTTVFLGRNYDSDFAPALIIFIIGFFCCFVWAAGFKFIRSRNGAAKALGILSVILFFGAIIAIVLSVSLSVAAANAVSNSYNSNTYTGTATAYSRSSYFTMPYGTSSVYISSTYNTWTAYGQTYAVGAAGYTTSTCYNANPTGYSDCPILYDNWMELVAKCGSSGFWYKATAGSNIYCSGGSLLYFSPNDILSGITYNTGYISYTLQTS